MKSVVLTLGKVSIASVLFLGLSSCTSPALDLATDTPKSPAVSTPAPTPARSPATSLPTSLQTTTITPTGFGPIQIGMTVAEAEQAAGMPLVALDGSTPDLSAACSYVKLQNSPVGLEFMLDRDRIVRVDIKSRGFQEVEGQPVEVDLTAESSQITTKSGARIGNTEAEVQALYPGQIQISPHKYVPGGHYLTLVPQDAADGNARIVFETDGDRVTYIRAGQLPQVEWVERCG